MQCVCVLADTITTASRSYGNKMNKIDVGLWIYDACAMLGSPLHKRQNVKQALADEPLLKAHVTLLLDCV